MKWCAPNPNTHLTPLYMYRRDNHLKELAPINIFAVFCEQAINNLNMLLQCQLFVAVGGNYFIHCYDVLLYE